MNDPDFSLGPLFDTVRNQAGQVTRAIQQRLEQTTSPWDWLKEVLSILPDLNRQCGMLFCHQIMRFINDIAPYGHIAVSMYPIHFEADKQALAVWLRADIGFEDENILCNVVCLLPQEQHILLKSLCKLVRALTANPAIDEIHAFDIELQEYCDIDHSQ